jgi:hypothetical protein
MNLADFNSGDAWSQAKKGIEGMIGDDPVGKDIEWRSRLRTEQQPALKARNVGIYSDVYVQQTAEMMPPFALDDADRTFARKSQAREAHSNGKVAWGSTSASKKLAEDMKAIERSMVQLSTDHRAMQSTQKREEFIGTTETAAQEASVNWDKAMRKLKKRVMKASETDMDRRGECWEKRGAHKNRIMGTDHPSVKHSHMQEAFADPKSLGPGRYGHRAKPLAAYMESMQDPAQHAAASSSLRMADVVFTRERQLAGAQISSSASANESRGNSSRMSTDRKSRSRSGLKMVRREVFGKGEDKGPGAAHEAKRFLSSSHAAHGDFSEVQRNERTRLREAEAEALAGRQPKRGVRAQRAEGGALAPEGQRSLELPEQRNRMMDTRHEGELTSVESAMYARGHMEVSAAMAREKAEAAGGCGGIYGGSGRGENQRKTSRVEKMAALDQRMRHQQRAIVSSSAFGAVSGAGRGRLPSHRAGTKAYARWQSEQREAGDSVVRGTEINRVSSNGNPMGSTRRKCVPSKGTTDRSKDERMQQLRKTLSDSCAQTRAATAGEFQRLKAELDGEQQRCGVAERGLAALEQMMQR